MAPSQISSLGEGRQGEGGWGPKAAEGQVGEGGEVCRGASTKGVTKSNGKWRGALGGGHSFKYPFQLPAPTASHHRTPYKLPPCLSPPPPPPTIAFPVAAVGSTHLRLPTNN